MGHQTLLPAPFQRRDESLPLLSTTRQEHVLGYRRHGTHFHIGGVSHLPAQHFPGRDWNEWKKHHLLYQRPVFHARKPHTSNTPNRHNPRPERETQPPRRLLERVSYLTAYRFAQCLSTRPKTGR